MLQACDKHIIAYSYLADSCPLCEAEKRSMTLYVVFEENSDLDDGWTKIRGIYDSREAAVARMEELADNVESSPWTDELSYYRGNALGLTYMYIGGYELNSPVALPWEDEYA